MEKLTFGRGLEAGSGFGSGDTEEGVPNKEKKQQESIILLRSSDNVDMRDKGTVLRAWKIYV